MSRRRSEQDPGTVRKIADYLFGKAKQETDDQFLDRRTDISGREFFRACTFYRTIQESFNSKASGKIADILMRLSISRNRLGRSEGVESIRGEFPKVETVRVGTSELLLSRRRGEDQF